MTVAVALLGAITTAVERTESLDLRWLLAALVLQVGSLAFLGFAWRNILAAAYPGRVPIFSVVAAYVTGAALNGFVPARAGEGAKVALARARIPDRASRRSRARSRSCSSPTECLAQASAEPTKRPRVEPVAWPDVGMPKLDGI